jgi:hypothetical protein
MRTIRTGLLAAGGVLIVTEWLIGSHLIQWLLTFASKF